LSKSSRSPRARDDKAAIPILRKKIADLDKEIAALDAKKSEG